MTHEELKTWAAELTEEQLGYALNEMRDRGAAVAYYDANEMAMLIDRDPSEVKDWMSENREHVEDSMCDAAREIFRGFSS